jgi:DNA-binding response OmpR family regulator
MDIKVLFIDDDPHWREIAQTALQDAGYAVRRPRMPGKWRNRRAAG